MTILPGYEPEASRASRDAEVCLGRSTSRYNLALGGRISRDPIGEDGGLNLYGYVDNNPINLLDPSGLFGIGVIGVGGADGGLAYPVSAGGQGYAGWGVFNDYSRDWNSQGAFYGKGGFLGPNSAVDSPRGYEPWSFGANAGLAVGPFLTNARNPCDLKGPFDSGTINTPWGALSVSWGRASDGRMIIFGSLTFGGHGASISSYPTTTKVPVAP